MAGYIDFSTNNYLSEETNLWMQSKIVTLLLCLNPLKMTMFSVILGQLCFYTYFIYSEFLFPPLKLFLMPGSCRGLCTNSWENIQNKNGIRKGRGMKRGNEFCPFSSVAKRIKFIDF